MKRWLSIFIVGLIPVAAAPAWAGTNDLDWAPFYSRDTDVHGAARRRMLGPFFEERKADDGKSLWAIHPVVGTIRDPSDQRSETDIVWPLLISKRHRDFWQWRLAIFGLYRDYDVTDPDSRYSLWFLPVYFQGRGKDREPYFAILPFGGKISDILIWDKMTFVLFPIYADARVNDIQTYSYLWPIMATSHGTNVPVKRAYMFPMYGYSYRENEYDKRFLLWPFWTSSRYFYPNSHGYGWILFPLVGHVKLTDQETWMFLPPFTRFSRSATLHQINCPWPIFQYSSGEIDKLYFWPIVGYKVIGDTETDFLFWPIGITSRRKTPQGIDRRYFVVPILYTETLTRRVPDKADAAAQDTGETGLEEIVDRRTVKIWPLFIYRREKAQSYFGFPSLFPYRDYDVVERNYAALWTLYSHSSGAGETEDELLWGLVQWRRSSAGLVKTSFFPLYSVERDQGGDGMEWSILKGLVGRERDGDRKRMRLLYFIRW